MLFDASPPSDFAKMVSLGYWGEPIGFAGSVHVGNVSALFRQAALESRRTRMEGDVGLRDAGKLRFACYLLPLAALPFLPASFFWTHARVQTVPGWLTTSDGLVLVRAERAGPWMSCPFRRETSFRRLRSKLPVLVHRDRSDSCANRKGLRFVPEP